MPNLALLPGQTKQALLPKWLLQIKWLAYCYNLFYLLVPFQPHTHTQRGRVKFYEYFSQNLFDRVAPPKSGGRIVHVAGKPEYTDNLETWISKSQSLACRESHMVLSQQRQDSLRGWRLDTSTVEQGSCLHCFKYRQNLFFFFFLLWVYFRVRTLNIGKGMWLLQG